MQIVYGIFFYLSIHAALIAIAWSYTTSVYLGISPGYHYYIFLFFAVLLVYNFDRLKQSKYTDWLNVPKRTQFLAKYKKLGLILLSISFFFSVYFGSYLSFDAFVLFSLMSFITLSYFFLASIVSKKSIFIAFFKPILLAFVWCSIVTILPITFSKRELYSYGVIALWLERFLIFLINALWFDFRDRKGDETTQKLNPAVLVSEKKYFFWLIGIPILGIVSNVFVFQFYSSMILAIYFFILGIYVQKKNWTTQETFYDVWIDFPLLLSPITVILFYQLC